MLRKSENAVELFVEFLLPSISATTRPHSDSQPRDKLGVFFQTGCFNCQTQGEEAVVFVTRGVLHWV